MTQNFAICSVQPGIEWYWQSVPLHQGALYSSILQNAAISWWEHALVCNLYHILSHYQELKTLVHYLEDDSQDAPDWPHPDVLDGMVFTGYFPFSWSTLLKVMPRSCFPCSHSICVAEAEQRGNLSSDNVEWSTPYGNCHNQCRIHSSIRYLTHKVQVDLFFKVHHLFRLKLILEKCFSLKVPCRSGGGCSWICGAIAAATTGVLFTCDGKLMDRLTVSVSHKRKWIFYISSTWAFCPFTMTSFYPSCFQYFNFIIK